MQSWLFDRRFRFLRHSLRQGLGGQGELWVITHPILKGEENPVMGSVAAHQNFEFYEDIGGTPHRQLQRFVPLVD